jgi:hypothetical protein
MCGSNPAFHILKKWIEQKDLKGEDASEVMAAIPSHLQTPGPDIIREFYVSMPSQTDRCELRVHLRPELFIQYTALANGEGGHHFRLS